MKILKVLVLLLVITACAPYPHKGYYELNDAIAHAKTDEESEYYKARLDQFEKDANAAVLFYERRAKCHNGTDKFGEQTMWLCQSHHSTPRDPGRKPFKDVVDQVNAYRRDKYACGCANRADVMRGLFGRRY